MKAWQLAEAQRIAKKRTQAFMSDAANVPMVLPPRALTIGVRKALSLPVAALVQYPMPNGKFAHKFERIA